jgi:hypothetical protein
MLKKNDLIKNDHSHSEGSIAIPHALRLDGLSAPCDSSTAPLRLVYVHHVHDRGKPSLPTSPPWLDDKNIRISISLALVWPGQAWQSTLY